MKKYRLAFLMLCQTPLLLFSQTSPNLFDKTKMEYKGDKKAQAKQLMRKVAIWGNLAKEAKIDTVFLQLLSTPIEFTKAQLKKYLLTKQMAEQETGGSIDSGLSFIMLNGSRVYARYFVIHDVSSPVYKDSFPKNIDDASWVFNDPGKWIKKVTHTYVTRTGSCNKVTDFSEGLRATKFELKTLGAISRGLFLHIELIQPRKYPPGNSDNAPVAPQPGFTISQYQKLALLYVCAAMRKGAWLVPAFHANIDEGLNDSHDDPQNFEVEKFTNAVLQLVEAIKLNAG